MKAEALRALGLGVSWLVNHRALAHGNEAVQAYCVTLFLAIGLHALSKARTGRGGIVDAALAAACGLAAAFSFGSGIACFVAFRSEEHTSELQSLMRISYAVFCLTKKTKRNHTQTKSQHTKQLDTKTNTK